MNNRIIKKLLNGAEVEWKSLGDIAVIKTGQAISKSIISNNIGNYPVINSGKEPLGYINQYNTENDPIGITTRGAGVGSITWQDGKYFRGNLNYSVTVKNNKELNVRFLYHSLLFMQKEIHSLCTFTGIPALNSSELKKLEIPIPPLEAQEKIVKTLDKFTELESTLESELSLRVKQYHYYRDLLLNENEKNPFFKNAEYRCLGDITLLSSNIRWKNNTNSYKYIDLTSVDRENHSIGETIEISALTAPSRAQKLVVKDDVIFATTRPTQLRFAFINEEFENSIASTGYCVLRANTDLALPKWIYHNLGSIDFKNFLEENQSGSAYPAVSDSKVKEYKIPVPSLDIQEKIILILDKFENLANSIKDGLPREIELRRKQYEYYRNELLSFSNQGE